MTDESVELDNTSCNSDTDALLSSESDHDINDVGLDGNLDKEENEVHTNTSWLSRSPRSVITAFSSQGWLRREISLLLRLAVPITLSLFFQFSMLLVSLLFISHIPNTDSALYLAAAGLASSFVNVTSTPVGHGLGTAADTLCSQAFGFKNYKRVGVIFQRGVFILGLFVLPICGVWLNTESLLLLFHQPPCVATLSAFYINVYCVSLPFLFLFILLQHYLQSQSLVWQFVIIGVIANCVNILLHAVVIYGLQLGFKGAVIALVISTCLPTLLIVFYIRVRNLHKLTWGGWSFESLEEWLEFLKLAIPGLIMFSLEWWSAEIGNFIAGYISKNELAANAAFYQAASIVYMPVIAISMAISIRVGNELGAGNPSGAKKASFVAIGITLLLCVVYSVLFLATKDYIGDVLVPGNEVVRKKIADLMILGTVYVYFDHVQSTIGGVFRGSGRQYIGAIMNFISYYLIGLPLGITLALKLKWGVVGLWIGMGVGVVVLSVAFVVILFRTNWKKQSEIAIQRAKEFDGVFQTGSTTESVNDAREGAHQMTNGDLNSFVSNENRSSIDETSFVSECPDEDNIKLVQMAQLTDGSVEDEREIDVEFEEEASDKHKLREEKDDVSQETKYSRKTVKRRIFLVLSRGSFFTVGLTVLLLGVVASQFHPHVDHREYENCSLTTQLNDSSYW